MILLREELSINRQELLEEFQTGRDVGLEFSRIENKLNQNRFLCGLLKITELIALGWDINVSPLNRDLIYICPVTLLPNLTLEDVIYLRRCGFSFDEATNGIVYGT